MENKDKKEVMDKYVVMATAFGHKSQIISNPMCKEHADNLADKIKSAMEEVTGDYQMFKDIKVAKAKDEPAYLSTDKKDPYNYIAKDKDDPYKGSILDSLDKKIKK